MFRLTSILMLCGCASLAAASDPVRLNTDIFPPYQVKEGDQLGGSSVTALSCIFKALAQPYEIRVLPWERAIHEVSQGRADGFFSATRTRRANEFAQLSAPLALEKWYWYSNNPEHPLEPRRTSDPQLKIGGIRGSNQVAWLEKQGVEVNTLVGNTRQLLQLLERGRIDAFLADQRTLRIELTPLPLGLRPRHQHFQQYTNLGVYFADDFLHRHPSFLSRFNDEVFHCIPEMATLTAEERERIQVLHQQLFADWPGKPEIIEAVLEQNRRHQQLDVTRIIQLDQQWIAETSQHERPLINSVLAHPLSHWLTDQQIRHNGLITEVMVTDYLGLNVAVSEITTDYWQGDEAKFTESFFASNTTPFMGPLEYDQSTQGFQVHVSSQIIDPISGKVVGVLVIGLDIELALRMNGISGEL
ncbi:transporter substrate-binding domain-containing protein [Pseudomonas jilinensis]|uniref:Uncharacterized protein n=1 Tax=Pseudomonas jilinensis TaxID=2078689 RepID=A0A396S285_9PSED|nr:transporter substrate-binding domain-containing protein [Pseudomonas jilinensis]RHW23146.1 hypothetical protein C2846_01725 [Pseudomonas jilinensis]